MKKVLWFSNCAFSNEKTKVTGTWQIAMGEALVETGQIELFNIVNGDVKDYTRVDCNGISQWIIPFEKTKKNGLPSKKTIDFIRSIEQQVKPDLIHIWGTERYWGLLAAQGYLSAPVLLDIQGILYAIAKVFYGGLTNKEIIGCIGLKEILLPQRLLYFRKKIFEKKGIPERAMIRSNVNIGVQSEWVKTHIEYEKKNSNKIYYSGILLREEFYKAKKWENYRSSQKIIFTLSSGVISYKGFHVLFRAVAALKAKHPDIELRIAGNDTKNKLIQDGYFYWLQREARKLGITDSITWLGPLDADGIINELYISSLFVVPSYAESYCLALAEAMMIGVPSVISYAGAMPELAEHNKSALFFPVGDEMSCACQIDKLLSDSSLSENISLSAIDVASKRNDKDKVVLNQLAIYDDILSGIERQK